MRTWFLVLLSVVVLGLAGCNTVAGAGKDVTDSAHWVKQKL